MVLRHRWSPVLVVAIGLLVAGCWSRGPAVQFVEGIVVYDGQPVAGATVFFTPESSGGSSPPGIPATGRTREDGTFSLNGFLGAKAGAGTAVGTYLVTVLKQESGPMPEPDASGVLPPAPPDMKVRNLLPIAYSQGRTSPLRAEVRQGKNQFRFELTGRPGGEVK